MTDDGSGGDLTQGTQPMGGEPDPNSGSSGGDPTHGDPAAVERWDDESFRRERLNAMHKTGYGKGRAKGQQEGISSLLKSLGVASVDELRARLDPTEEPEPTAAQAQTQQSTAQAPTPEVESKAMREARLAKQKLERELESQRQAAAILEARSGRALRGEIKARLVQAGAHEGVDELVSLLVDVERRFGWAGDGQEIVALDRHDDGSTSESNETLEDVIADVAKKRPWFFRGEPKQGSGYQGNPRPAPRPGPADYDFRRNYDDWMRRRR